MATIETRIGNMPAAGASRGMKVHAIQTGTVAVKTTSEREWDEDRCDW
jgi:hypothetical protein